MARYGAAVDASDSGGAGNGVRILRLLPGGEPPGPVEKMTAVIVVGALVYLIMVRKAFGPVLARGSR